mmetsp:Transcript_4131/g.9672  ORF Transcript_4131/g.9672 Transcript_4131/m.9672 type:complete len:324 (+) Transcript_4131:547-1518(+)
MHHGRAHERTRGDDHRRLLPRSQGPVGRVRVARLWQKVLPHKAPVLDPQGSHDAQGALGARADARVAATKGHVAAQHRAAIGKGEAGERGGRVPDLLPVVKRESEHATREVHEDKGLVVVAEKRLEVPHGDAYADVPHHVARAFVQRDYSCVAAIVAWDVANISGQDEKALVRGRVARVAAQIGRDLFDPPWLAGLKIKGKGLAAFAVPEHNTVAQTRHVVGARRRPELPNLLTLWAQLPEVVLPREIEVAVCVDDRAAGEDCAEPALRMVPSEGEVRREVARRHDVRKGALVHAVGPEMLRSRAVPSRESFRAQLVRRLQVQ